MKILFTDEAKKDIVDIVQYVARNNSEVANNIFDKIWYTCNLIANMPEMGTAVSSLIECEKGDEQIQEIINAIPLLDNVRRFPVSGFSRLIIFYKIESKKLKIIRILHGSRDIPAIFMTMFTDID